GVTMKRVGKILGVLSFAAALAAPMWLWRANTTVSAQGQHAKHRDRPHMHMKNWAAIPTGITGGFPLDPNTIPKFRNQLTKPPVHVPVGTQREPSTGRNLPLYDIDQRVIQAQMLPPGFPTTKAYAYGGRVNFAEAGQTSDIQTAFTVPGPTIEAVRRQRI